MGLQHLIEKLLAMIRRNQRIDRHRNQGGMIIPVTAASAATRSKDLICFLHQPPDSHRQIADGDRLGTFLRNHAIDFDRRIRRDARDGPVDSDVDRLNISLVGVQRVDEAAGRIAVVGSSPLFQLGRFDGQVRVFIKSRTTPPPAASPLRRAYLPFSPLSSVRPASFSSENSTGGRDRATSATP